MSTNGMCKSSVTLGRLTLSPAINDTQLVVTATLLVTSSKVEGTSVAVTTRFRLVGSEMD